MRSSGCDDITNSQSIGKTSSAPYNSNLEQAVISKFVTWCMTKIATCHVNLCGKFNEYTFKL